MAETNEVTIPIQRQIYIIHFDEKLKHAGHYVGSTDNVERRMKQHATGKGARLMQVIGELGISWQLAITFSGSRVDERNFKNRKNTPKYCPICQAAKTKKDSGVKL